MHCALTRLYPFDYPVEYEIRYLMSQHQHVIFIVLDTLRRDRLSSYGNTQQISPEFDAFAQRGSLFQRAIASAQWTMPSHASMFTGVYPSTHRLIEAYEQLDGSYATLPEILQLEGYHTVAFCNNPLVGLVENGLQRGFDAFYNYCGASPNSPFDVARLPGQRALTEHWRRFVRYMSQQFTSNYPLFHMMLKPQFATFWQRMVNYKGNTERSINDFIAYWEQQQKSGDQPMFAFINLMGAHMPYHPPQEYVRKINPDLATDKAARQFVHRFNVDVAGWASPRHEPPSQWEQDVIDLYYQAEVMHQDAQLGRVLHMLEKSGALDNTMVIIVADHGEGHGEHGFFGHSFVVYQELVHVPMAIYHPHYPAKGIIEDNVSTRRIFHTVLDYVGIQPPIAADDPNADVTGLSFARSLEGLPDQEQGIAFAEAYPPRTFLSVLERYSPEVVDEMRLNQVRRAVYQGDDKLTMIGDQIDGLFDVGSDLLDVNNLAGQNPQKAAQMQAQIEAFVGAAQGQQFGISSNEKISAEVTENLRALGYFE